MKARDEHLREELRNRYFEVSLETVLAEPPETEIEVRLPHRPIRWLPAVAAAFLLIVFLVMRGDDPPGAAGISGGKVEGVVVSPTGEPVAGTEVRLELGWVAHEFTSWKGWESAASLTAKTDDAGAFRIEEVPEGATGLVFCQADGKFARDPAAARMEIRLGEPGRLEGRITAKKSLLRQLKVYCRSDGWRGFRPNSPEIAKDGSFAFEGLPPGPGQLTVQWSNWVVFRTAIVIAHDETTTAPPIRVRSTTPVGPDPLVDARTAVLVDGRGKPVAGVQLIWSSPWADGGSSSDEKGEVKLQGGGVMIGSPPFVLRLSRLTGKEKQYVGTFGGVRGGRAVVRLAPLRTVTGRVNAAGADIATYKISYRSGGDSPRLYTGRVADGVYTIEVPAGRGEALLVTPAGKLHREEWEIEAGEEPLERNIETE